MLSALLVNAFPEVLGIFSEFQHSDVYVERFRNLSGRLSADLPLPTPSYVVKCSPVTQKVIGSYLYLKTDFWVAGKP
jgi:hypothetical protein